MLTRRKFGTGIGFLSLAALATIVGCDEVSTGPAERSPEDERKSEEARNASIEAMKKKGASKSKSK